MTVDANQSAPHKRKRRMAREPQLASAPAQAKKSATERTPAAQRLTKIQRVIDLPRRPDGASVDALVHATGWLPHTIRAALTGLKKRGHIVVSVKRDDGTRIYRISGLDAA